MVCGVLWQMEGDVIAFPHESATTCGVSSLLQHDVMPSLPRPPAGFARSGEHVAATKDAKGRKGIPDDSLIKIFLKEDDGMRACSIRLSLIGNLKTRSLLACSTFQESEVQWH
ncbi:hypothetical protein CEXT_361191 [Caerostris extrusa]|uniref:Uncharacterized protein n=1 Tax=Caerostris extrusa TaxID=172846 RepID=A0AAV4TRE7_CAEEX|nr:hypothetical protein CEXT_361191 [Caerostris extrusa]